MSGYTHGHHESVLRSHLSRTVENSAAYLAERLEPGMTMLDVGCGPGNLTVDLARRTAPGRVIGIDNAETIVETAREMTPDDVDNVEFRAGDVYALEFDDDTFDVVHAHQVLQHLPDPVGALREMRRVARPGGIVAVRDADFASMEWHPSDDRFEQWRELYRAVATGNGAEPNAGQYLEEWAHVAGLDEVAASTSMWWFSSTDERSWWGSLWADRIRDSALGEQALERGLASRSELDDLAQAWLDWGDQPDGWYTVTHGEIIAIVP
ncbi:MAG: methyltransferase domain-containing protein [Actinomycetota bacterium]